MMGWDNMGGTLDVKGTTMTDTSVVWEGSSVDMGQKSPAKLTLTMDAKKALKFTGEIGGQKAFDYDCK